MKTAWNRRARRDAYFYVETAHWDRDPEKFFAIGEQRAQLLIDPVLAALPTIDRGGLAVDVGCGVGRFTRALGLRFARVLGVDISGEMIAQAREANAARGNLSFAEGDGLRLPADDRSADFVWSYEVFQHMPTHSVIENNLRDISRILKPSGTALLHFRTSPEAAALLDGLKGVAPDWLVGVAHRALGRDRLMADRAWRGTAPMAAGEIAQACQRAGLTVIETRPDPTHAHGIRLFAVLRPADSATG